METSVYTVVVVLALRREDDPFTQWFRQEVYIDTQALTLRADLLDGLTVAAAMYRDSGYEVRPILAAIQGGN